jgi:catechol O-methyltransferase
MNTLVSRVAELGGKRLPVLRWSVLRMVIGTPWFLKHWQVGDGREEAVASYALANATRGDLDGVVRAIDDYAYRYKFLMNIGDEKGRILDSTLERVRPKRVLELGAYVGYSALRIARKLPPGGHLYSVEYSVDNATIARRVIEHAGVADRVTFIVGQIGDGGHTVARLTEQHGFRKHSLDLAFLDHDKNAYLPDLHRILAAEWLRPGAVVVADNVRFPGAPRYREFMNAQEGKRFRTEAHETHVEYQTLLKDTVLVSSLLA